MTMNSTDKPTDTNRYAWELAQKEIDAYIQESGTKPMVDAWLIAQRMIAAQASIYRPEHSMAVSMSMAWEDFEMACRGIGQPGIGGGIFHLWSRTSRTEDKRLQTVLTEAFKAAVVATDTKVLRYAMGHRNTPIATLDKGFGKREVSPISEKPLASAGALSHDWFNSTVEAAASSAAPTPTQDDVVGRPSFKFTVINGGKVNDPKPFGSGVTPPTIRKPRS